MVITVYADRSFTFEMKTPPVSYFLKKAAKIQSGSKAPGRDKAGAVTKAQVREIAEKKMKDLNCDTIEVGHEDGRGLCPFDGSRSGGVTDMASGKRSKKAREGVDREKLYTLADAIKMVKERAKSKFDETIEIAMNLGVDPRHADQMVRGVVTLPNGTGRTLRVGVFARGAKAEEAKAAGADVVGAEDLVEKVRAARSISIAASPPPT